MKCKRCKQNVKRTYSKKSYDGKYCWTCWNKLTPHWNRKKKKDREYQLELLKKREIKIGLVSDKSKDVKEEKYVEFKKLNKDGSLGTETIRIKV